MTRLERLAWYEKTLLACADKSAEHVREAKRFLARTDLFFLLVFICKRKDVNRDWLYERCNEVQADPNGFIDLWPRGHYKSTIKSFGLIIQDILNDPEVTISIFSHTRPIAKGFLRQIKMELERNEDLKGLFPEIFFVDPKAESQKWSEDDGIVVKRKGNPKESTVEAWGVVDAQPTSKHFKVLNYDDVVTDGSVTSPEMITKTNDQLALSYNLCSENAAFRFSGTRYHFNDSWAELVRRGTAKLRFFAATKDGTVTGDPVLMTREELAKKRRDMGIYVFNCQMLNNPIADGKQGFKYDWLRYHRIEGDAKKLNKYIIVDPASEKKKESDYTAMGVIGLGSDANYYLLDGIRDRLNLRERGDAIFALHRRWKPDGVGYEKYGMQADIEYLQERMNDENYRFEITPLGGQIAKHDRIKAMVPIFEAGRFIFPESLFKTDYEGRVVDLVQAFIEEEYKAFPVGLHEDFFDMLARITDAELNALWPKPDEIPDRYAAPRRKKHQRSAWAA